MYKRVEAQIVLSGVSKKQLAQNIGISYNSLNLKLNGRRAFSLDEATEIKRLLNAEEPIETLFDRSA
jgi:DNA-binding XRE family transcriptional regulator